MPQTFTLDKVDEFATSKRSSEKIMMSTGHKASVNSKSYFTNYNRAKSLGGTAMGKRRSLITTMDGSVQTKQHVIN
jgi:hypothetical protein